jgi:hypothetical protein
MMDKKKRTAIIAAVAHYIETKEAAMAHAAGFFTVEEPEAKAPVPVVMSVWGVSGRHQQMQMRSLMQMKAFHGSRSKF